MDIVEKKFVEYYKELGSLFGFDSIIMSIYALLYVEPDMIAMEDLAKKTGYSLASISNKIRFLENIGQIKRYTKPGTRKVFIRIEKDFRKIARDHLVKKEETVVRLAKNKLPDIIKDCKTKAKTEEEKKKLKIVEDYYKQIMQMEILIKKIIKEIDKTWENDS